MKTLIASLIATAAGASIAIAPAAAQTNDAYRQAMDKAAAEHKTAEDKCEKLTGNKQDVCEAEADLARARAEVAAATKHNKDELRQARRSLIDAEYEVAEEKCESLQGDAQDKCEDKARATRKAELAKLDTDRERSSATGASSGGSQASGDRDADKAAALERCEKMTGDSKTACVIDNQGRMTAAAGAAAAGAAATGDRAQDAAGRAAEKTRDVAQSAAEKTKEAAATAAEKTGVAGAGERTREAVAKVKEKTAGAVEKTKDVAAGTAQKAESATERAGERVAKSTADAAITSKVKAGLVADPDLSGMEINVDTEKGVVMLSGFVESKAEADKAVKVAKGVEGVTSVKSAIKVK